MRLLRQQEIQKNAESLKKAAIGSLIEINE